LAATKPRKELWHQLFFNNRAMISNHQLNKPAAHLTGNFDWVPI